MSKIAEEKALEAYPNPQILPGFDSNKHYREGYIVGYDQAMQDIVKDSDRLKYLSDEMGYAYACGCRKTMQDFLEKAEEWLEPTFKRIAGYYCGGDLMNDFKNYMQNESEK